MHSKAIFPIELGGYECLHLTEKKIYFQLSNNISNYLTWIKSCKQGDTQIFFLKLFSLSNAKSNWYVRGLLLIISKAKIPFKYITLINSNNERVENDSTYISRCKTINILQNNLQILIDLSIILLNYSPVRCRLMRYHEYTNINNWS